MWLGVSGIFVIVCDREILGPVFGGSYLSLDRIHRRDLIGWRRCRQDGGDRSCNSVMQLSCNFVKFIVNVAILYALYICELMFSVEGQRQIKPNMSRTGCIRRAASEGRRTKKRKQGRRRKRGRKWHRRIRDIRPRFFRKRREVQSCKFCAHSTRDSVVIACEME